MFTLQPSRQAANSAPASESGLSLIAHACKTGGPCILSGGSYSFISGAVRYVTVVKAAGWEYSAAHCASGQMIGYVISEASQRNGTD